MKTYLACFIFLIYPAGISFQSQNLEFVNRDPDALYQKFVIHNGKTSLTINGLVTMVQTWNQVPVNFDNSDGRSRYKMVVTDETDTSIFTYEFSWIYIKSSDKYSGHLKVNTYFKNGNESISTSSSFTGKKL